MRRLFAVQDDIVADAHAVDLNADRHNRIDHVKGRVPYCCDAALPGINRW
ncbi:hypothetical protein [Streptomyces marokkonensis]